MFKRLFLISGLLALGLTVLVYFRFMVPRVDVTVMEPVLSAQLASGFTASEGDVVELYGTVDRSGTSMLGKREVILRDSDGVAMVMVTLVLGESGHDLGPGQEVKVKGVWHPNVANNVGSKLVLGTMSDARLVGGRTE